MNEFVKHVRSRDEKKYYNRRVIRRNLIGTLMAAPPFIGFVLCTLVPMAISLWISFTELHGAMLKNAVFVGFANYVQIFKDPLVGKALRNTLFYCVTVVLNAFICLFLANLLQAHEVAGTKAIRVLLFLPQVCTGTAVTLMWSYVFSTSGMVNVLLNSLGVNLFRPYELVPDFRIALVIISIWQGGTNIILMQSALANVDKSLQESARIDGATEMQVFWKITFPGITPTLFYMLIMNFIAAAQEMALQSVFMGTPERADYAGLTVTWYIYYTATGTRSMAPGYGYGFACALSWFYSLALIVITRLLFKLSDKWVTYD